MDDSAWQLPEAEIHELGPRASTYCVCIPILNEGARIRAQLESMRKVPGMPDIVITDGGSTDGSTEPGLLRSLGVRALLIKRGAGRQGSQLRIGLAFCLRQGYEGVITIDGNNKDGVDAIPRFVDALEGGADLVMGSRFAPGGRAVNTPWLRLLAIHLIHAPAMSLAARHRFRDTTNGFRGYSRDYLLHPEVQPFRNIFENYELLWYLGVRATRVGCRAVEVPVERRYPDKGPTPTKISPLKGGTQIVGELWALLRGRFNPPGAPGAIGSPTAPSPDEATGSGRGDRR